MIEPLISAYNVWLAVLNSMPVSIQALYNLVLGLFALNIIISIWRTSR